MSRSDQRPKVSIHWFRRDLRMHDNHGLYRALVQHGDLLPLFIFDTDILDRLEDREDRRVAFIHDTLRQLKERSRAHGGDLLVEHGRPVEIWKKLLDRYDVTGVTAASDHEPYGIARDEEVQALLREKGIPFALVKDISIFERKEVMKSDGTPYLVYTPYSRRWKENLRDEMLDVHPSEDHLDKLWQGSVDALPTLEAIGFSHKAYVVPNVKVPDALLTHYHETRNTPGIAGTSGMSVHLRFGTVSVRELVRRALKLNEKFLNELIWREFYMMILYNFPHVVAGAFRPAYDRIPWRNNEEEFAKWCEGNTGYPLVDAGMRELNNTGYMHNRVRMVVAGFLTKHLLISWQWGETYFAARLMDFELSSNNGNWQWAAGSGCDAAPYFRVFNPTTQLEKFDRKLNYVKQWLPEYGTANYVQPMVVHEAARKRAIATYKEALDGGAGRKNETVKNELFP